MHACLWINSLMSFFPRLGRLREGVFGSLRNLHMSNFSRLFSFTQKRFFVSVILTMWQLKRGLNLCASSGFPSCSVMVSWQHFTGMRLALSCQPVAPYVSAKQYGCSLGSVIVHNARSKIHKQSRIRPTVKLPGEIWISIWSSCETETAPAPYPGGKYPLGIYIYWSVRLGK